MSRGTAPVKTVHSVINQGQAGAALLRAHAELSRQTLCFGAGLLRKAQCVREEYRREIKDQAEG